MNKINRCTTKQKNFVRELILGKDPGNATQAAYDTYNVKTRVNAGKLANANLKKPSIKREIELVMEQYKITDDFLIKKMKNGMNAKVITNYKGEAEETDIPDYAIQHRYWQDAAKMKDMFPVEKYESRNYNVDLMLETMSKKEIAQLLKDQLKQLNETSNYKSRRKRNDEGHSQNDKTADIADQAGYTAVGKNQDIG